MPRVESHAAALVVPGLWGWLWRRRIDEFENDPRRLCPSITGVSAEAAEATRRRWLAAKVKTFKALGNRPPRERHAAGEPYTFRRGVLGGNTWAGYAPHPLVADRAVPWLTVDVDDLVTVGDSPVAFTSVNRGRPSLMSDLTWVSAPRPGPVVTARKETFRRDGRWPAETLAGCTYTLVPHRDSQTQSTLWLTR